ncbi:MAG: glycine oxidase ThiO [Thiobacillaceae bacterium]
MISAHTIPDVLVVGAGVSGLATALRLTDAGRRVTVLDRGPVARESTWAGAGILSLLLPWDYPEAVNVLAVRGRRLWPEWIERLQALTGLDAEYRVSGMLVADAGHTAQARAWGERYGRRVEAPPEGLRQGAPHLADSLWLPEVAQVRNPRLARLLESAVRTLGVEILPETAVTGFDVRQGKLHAVETSAGRLACGQTVICAGAWSRDLLGPLALGMNIRPVRGQILLLSGPAGLLPCIVYRGGRYLVPRADGHVLVGSTLEEAGFNKSTTAEAGQALLAFALETWPALRAAAVERQWAGLRPGSPGNLPVIAQHPEVENLFLNAGHFRYGLTMAPAAAELITALVLGNRPAIDPSPYAWPSG